MEKAGEGEGGRAAGGGSGPPPLGVDLVTPVDVASELAALRVALERNQQKVAELSKELEEERAASASAASEAMLMILRLQREKAEVQMEARQFKRFAEEKMAHEQRELLVLRDAVYEREQALAALSLEIQAYRHRLLTYGIDPVSHSPPDSEGGGGSEAPVYDCPSFEYPSLTCCVKPHQADQNVADDWENDADLDDKYPSGETPCRRKQLQNLDRRIRQLERSPSQTSLVKEVVMTQSPRGRSRHVRYCSTDSFGSPLAKVRTSCGRQQEEFPTALDGSSDFGADDDCDRVCTVDAVYCGTPTVKVCEVHDGSPKDLVCRVDGFGVPEEMDVRKLYVRLQALEADRESMRQAIISMGADKAQLVLLKEIAQQFCRDAPPPPTTPPSPPPPERKLMKKPPLLGQFAFMLMIKWVASFVFRRTRH